MPTIAQPTINAMSPQLVVTNLAQAIAFYTNKLGFELAFCYDDFYAGIQREGCSIHLKCGTPSVAERRLKRENNDLDIVFSVSGVEGLYNQLQEKSVEIVQPLCDQPYGKEFYIADPDGYILAFVE